MKSTGIITAIGILIILVVAGFAFYRSTTPEDANVSPANEDPSFIEVDNEEVSLEGDTIDEVQDMPTSAPEAPQNEASGILPANSEPITVSLTDTGFEPSELTVVSGTTVTFVNNGQAPHWPASDVHPTHEVLPEFDAKRGLTTGETYSHTFTKVGTWSMHDHLRPSSTGTITVE